MSRATNDIEPPVLTELRAHPSPKGRPCATTRNFGARWQSRATTTQQTTDLVTIAWLGLIAVAAAFPSISKVAFGDVSIKTRRLRSASNVYEDTLKNVTKLPERWSVASTTYVEKMQRDDAQRDQTREELSSITSATGSAKPTKS